MCIRDRYMGILQQSRQEEEWNQQRISKKNKKPSISLLSQFQLQMFEPAEQKKSFSSVLDANNTDVFIAEHDHHITRPVCVKQANLLLDYSHNTNDLKKVHVSLFSEFMQVKIVEECDLPFKSLRVNLIFSILDRSQQHENGMQGFQLSGKGKKMKFYSEHYDDIEDWYLRLSNICINRKLNHDYKLTKLLGVGGFSKVYEGLCHRDGKNYAIKSIRKTLFKQSKKEIFALMQSIKIWRRLDHPNIAKLFQVYEGENHVFLVMELLSGHDLSEVVHVDGPFSVESTRDVIHQILSGLNYLHNMGYVHRDLKPHNVVFADNERKVVKLIDFGFLDFASSKYPIFSKCGTIGYVAPEVLSKSKVSPTPSLDIYSLGCVFYYCLYGKSPFKNQDQKIEHERNAKGIIELPEMLIKKVNESGLDLLTVMLSRYPEGRASTTDCLKHVFFTTDYNDGKSPDKMESLARLSFSLLQGDFEDEEKDEHGEDRGYILRERDRAKKKEDVAQLAGDMFSPCDSPLKVVKTTGFGGFSDALSLLENVQKMRRSGSAVRKHSQRIELDSATLGEESPTFCSSVALLMDNIKLNQAFSNKPIQLSDKSSSLYFSHLESITNKRKTMQFGKNTL
eukprot:TRINITY_DN12845_c0_g1_i1.p1 TRINITY_DN12845_c0_g1~~TRINITY_DN12845_c0_g1_i1.p1  ORF type:complete len:621 (-),score=96.07 TRINITY_DN12845_c0_g1_i1:170-2032(-)